MRAREDMAAFVHKEAVEGANGKDLCMLPSSSAQVKRIVDHRTHPVMQYIAVCERKFGRGKAFHASAAVRLGMLGSQASRTRTPMMHISIGRLHWGNFESAR